jgi:hypothetical protein
MPEGTAVADGKSLAVIGLLLAAIAAATIAVGATVVQRHLDGRLTLGETRPVNDSSGS